MGSAKEAAENYKMGIALLGVGGFVLFLGTLYLPFLALMPWKFCSLFSFGSLIIMMAMWVMMGSKKFFATLYNKSNILYSLAYTGSLIAGLYLSSHGGRYPVIIGLIILQFLSLSYLLFANLPYGK